MAAAGAAAFCGLCAAGCFPQPGKGVVFLSGPQLAGKAGQRAREMVAHGACGIMTGTPDAGSLSAEMLDNGFLNL